MNNMQQNKIYVDGINVIFNTQDNNKVVALEDINLSVSENEFLCVMGPSGCGKTTLLNVIAGLLTPTSGEVRLNGKAVLGPGPDRVVVFQSDAVFPWMTVEENVAFSMACKKKPPEEIRKVTDHFIDLVGLKDFRTAWPKHLSGGMRKRVDLARAYVADPEVMLLDEPFGPLDIMTKERLQEELLLLWKREPRTVIFITHDIEEALFLGDRVVVMTPRPGRIHSIIEPRLPSDRDCTVKTSAPFVELRKKIRDILMEGQEDGEL